MTLDPDPRCPLGFMDEGEPPRRRGCPVSVLPYMVLLILVALGAAWGAPDGLNDGRVAPASVLALPGPSHGGSPSLEPLAIGMRPAPPAPAASRNPLASHSAALIGGWATWYRDGPGLYAAAGPELRAAFGSDWRGTVVEVAGPGGAVVRVTLSDACACGERHGLPTFLDLSADAFSELAPLSWGIVAVSVELVPALPATDVAREMQ